jgi:hypothetical protein
MPGSVVTSVYTNPLTPLIFSDAAFNVGDQTINLGVTHNFTTGNPIWFQSNTPGNNAGLTKGRAYFVIVINTTTIKLAATYINAMSGTSVAFTTPLSGYGYWFSKAYFSGSRFSLSTISSYPCYAKSNVVFNSSIPVQIDISFPAYQSVYNTYSEITNSDRLIQLCGLRALSSGDSWYFGIGASFFPMIQLHTGDSGIYLGGSTLGWKQRYIITPSRQIQFWAGLTTATLSLIYTSPALNANTDLVLEYGANFNNLAISDCTIKYL